MKQVQENIWSKALIRGAILYGLFGLVITAFSVFLPQSFHQSPWNQELLLGISQRIVVFGVVPGVLWTLLFLQQSNPLMLGIGACWGGFLLLIGESVPALPPVISIVIGLLLAASATRDLLKQIETVRSYANKVNSSGEERTKIIGTIFETIVNTKSETLRTMSAETMKLFGGEGIDPLIKNLEHPHPKARQRIAYALGVIGDKTTIGHLKALAEKEQDAAVKEKVLAAISQITE